ncbi:MAG: ADP-ribosylglycohydrolase family protein [Acidothermaceae bacterium]
MNASSNASAVAGSPTALRGPDSPAIDFPEDYAERVYAGILGKIIGVYLGRPFEGWRLPKILDELGEIRYYVNDRHDIELKNHRLVVTDDDITGTFTFPRVLRDYPPSELDAVRVGRTWLNYVIEDRTVLWWGGRGNSTEHTAFLLLKDGLTPPETGSIARNGRVVAEQVGAQIFSEVWGLISPGNPERAADLARCAASVSHDGEALHAARVVAALVAQAFVERDVDRLLDTAAALIPGESLIRKVMDDVRKWHADGIDWQAGWSRINDRYGYDKYGGNCHVIPNHALVIHALVHGAGNFSRALGVVNSCGWDTDSNAGNVGCIAGVLGGLSSIDEGPDWRGPVRDRMYLPTADGGGTITDAAREALAVVGYAHTLQGTDPPKVKAGARFHFEFPGAVQGFDSEPRGALQIDNVQEHSTHGNRSLALRYASGIGTSLALTPTFITPDTVEIPPYGMVASPTLYPGQKVTAKVTADRGAVQCQLVIHFFNGRDRRQLIGGAVTTLESGKAAELSWCVPDTGGQPIADVGLAVTPLTTNSGTVLLHYLTWDGDPDVTLSRPADGGQMWRHAWVDAMDSFNSRWPEPFRLVQNRGTGMLIHGAREWRDYEVSADVTPHLARSVGLAARVQGLQRYYAVRLVGGTTVQLIKVLDGESILDEAPFEWEFGRTYELRLATVGDRVVATVGDTVLEAIDSNSRLSSGGIALLVEEGRTATNVVRVRPASAQLHALEAARSFDNPITASNTDVPQEGPTT